MCRRHLSRLPRYFIRMHPITTATAGPITTLQNSDGITSRETTDVNPRMRRRIPGRYYNGLRYPFLHRDEHTWLRIMTDMITLIAAAAGPCKLRSFTWASTSLPLHSPGSCLRLQSSLSASMTFNTTPLQLSSLPADANAADKIRRG